MHANEVMKPVKSPQKDFPVAVSMAPNIPLMSRDNRKMSADVENCTTTVRM